MIRAAITVIAIAIAATPAVADPEPGGPIDSPLARAREHYAARRFEQALGELEKAYRLEPRPEILFDMGQSLFNLERYAEALAAYERYLATDPQPREAALAQQAIAVTRDRMKPQPPPPPPPPRAPVDRPRSRARFDAWNIGLFVGAGVAGTTAGGLYIYARSLAADTSGMYRDYDERLDRAGDLRIAAAACGGVAIALVIAAGVRVLATPRDDIAIAITIDGDRTIGHATVRW